MLVISDYRFNTPGSIKLNKRLNSDASTLAEESGLETGVAGGAAQLNDYSRVTRERMPWVIIAITIATFLVLMIVLRALLLAAIAVALNLLTVAVAFGVLTLLFHIPESWPLGGHHYVDAVGATLIFGLVFGLSIDYAVFLLSRMREHYDAHGDNAAAVDFGLSPHRRGDHRRGGDHDGRLHRLRRRPDRDRQPARRRPHGRRHPRRHRRPHRPPAGPDAPARRPGLVAAEAARAGDPETQRLSANGR